MATWPASLPQQFEVGARMRRQSGFLRTDTDTGPFKQRKRFTAVSRFWSGTMLMNASQKATFETFYATTINEGADAFDFTDPVDASTVSARFTGPPDENAEQGVGFWRLSFELELLP